MGSLLENAKLIFQGAESKVYKTKYLDEDALVKERFSKKYRHPTIDADLIKSRTRCEVRNLLKARQKGIRVPYVLAVRPASGCIVMEFINGESLASFLHREHGWTGAERDLAEKLPEKLGTLICRLHDEVGITHGDLTSSNIILNAGELVLIDFGLASVGNNAEQRAVDLYVFTRALKANHAVQADGLINDFLAGYRKYSAAGEQTFLQLLRVQQRGRKRNLA